MQPNLSKVCLNTTNSHRAPYAVRSDTERNPAGKILLALNGGKTTQVSERAADGI